MSSAGRPGQPRRCGRIAAIARVVLAAIIVMAIWEGDLRELFRFGLKGVRTFFGERSYLPGYVLLYLEESGIPLPAPGDVFVMYVGVHVPHNLVAWLAAWLGLILIVVLAATSLFFISRLVGHRVGHNQ